MRIKLQESYDGHFEHFEAYDETFGIAKRLGFKSPREAWNANPLIQVSSDPDDLKIVEIRFGTALLKPMEGTIEGPDGNEPSIESLEATVVGDEFWPKGLQARDFALARDFYWSLSDAEII